MRAFLTLSLLALPAAARALVVTAEVNKVMVEMREPVMLAVKVSGP